MRATIILALVALVAFQCVVAETTIYSQNYAVADPLNSTSYLCGGAMTSTGYVNYTSGMCVSNTEGNSSYTVWVDSACSTFSFYSYDGVNCTSAGLKSASQSPIKCGVLTYTSKYMCAVNGTAATPPSFPPSGWAVSTTYYNYTDINASRSTPSTTCDPTTASYSVQSSARPVTCFQKPVSNSYSAGSISASCQDNVMYQVEWSSQTCDGTVQSVSSNPWVNTCTNGMAATPCANSGAPTLPTQSVNSSTVYATTYSYTDSNNCNAATASKVVKRYFYSGCLDAFTHTCSHNSTGGYTQTVTYFSDTDGTCAAANQFTSSDYTSGQCNIDSNGATTSTMYTCEDNGGGNTGSASTVSISMVSFLVAALVAMVASRQ